VHDANGLISDFVEKPPKENAPTNEINAGTYLFEREMLDWIPAGRNVSIEREAFPEIIASERLYSYTTDDYWMDLGRPDEYLAAHVDILAGRMPMLQPPLPARVYVEDGATIDPTVELGPNAVVGTGSIVGPRAVVRGSVLWNNVTIERGAVVEGAIVASGAKIRRDARVHEESVVGHYTVVPAGTVLERGSRVGATAPISGHEPTAIFLPLTQVSETLISPSLDGSVSSGLLSSNTRYKKGRPFQASFVTVGGEETKVSQHDHLIR
jgi:mannose-1-phosphate guanylyltransferase